MSTMRTSMNAKESINNLEIMSEALSKAANKPENYNTEWSYYLEQMSFEMHKMSNELKDLEYLFGSSHSKNTLYK